MTPERYKRIGELFDEALELAPAERASFLQQACGEDAGLCAEVERLLAHHPESEEFLSRPAMEVAATLLAQKQTASLAGRTISRYRVLSLLGAGGMGEVWLARDTGLERNVALKLLPAQFTRSQAHVQRFAQEARAASALNHPNIITIHEIGEAEGTHYIITEFVEGKTLRLMLSQPMPLGAVLEIATQIADALVAAHKAGILHRDLKPENVMVRPDGLVKVLDFGLAKLTERSDAGGEASPAILITDPGTVLGTISYMSPEQALAQPLDQRTDIFSFGVMLYEMLAGERPFQGVSHAAICDAILHHRPVPVTAVQPALPRELQWIIDHALEKDRNLRFQTAADLKAALQTLKRDSSSGAVVTSSGAAPQPLRQAGLRKRILRAATASGLLIASAGAGYLLWSGSDNTKSSAMRITSFTQLTRWPGQEIYPSLSPDGKLLIYASDAAGNQDIYLQRVRGETPINLTRGSVANETQPAFSPDGEEIAFRSDREGGGIFVMGATGEKVQRLIDHGHNPAWSPDGQEIAYSDGSFARPSERGNYPGPLRVVKLATGETRQITATDAVQPNWSPHGDRIAYWGIQGGGQRDIWTVGAHGGEPVAVTSDPALDWNPVWSPDGRYLYFASDRGGSMNLWRVPIDEQSGKLRGVPEPVTTPATWSGFISFSRDGRYMAYAQIVHQINLQQAAFDPAAAKIESGPVWITQGARVATDPDFSPDSAWVVFGTTGEKQEDLFIVRRDGTGLRQLTSDRYKDRAPRWSPDGRQIVFFSDRSGRYEYWMVRPDGSGLRQFSHTSGPGAQATIWSPDGQRLLCNLQTGPPLIAEVGQPWLQQSLQSLPAAGFPAGLMFWSWSADGRKLAGHRDGIYSYSFETHRYERLTEFGEYPLWLNDNRRLLFNSQDKLFLLDSRTGKTREILSVAPNHFQSLGLSRDGRVLCFSLKTTDADIWLASLEAEP
ncbi:MAG TPA: protein kinase [Blastocatellia bacterium]|nr:protein kinase [Blastocatellia bacterium]